jgi:hypothetical protein
MNKSIEGSISGRLIVAVFAAAVIGFGIVAVLRDSKWRASGIGAASKPATGTWARRTVHDLSMEAPFELERGPDVSAKLPPQLVAAMDYFDLYQGAGGLGRFNAAISRLAYKPGIPTSLDGAVTGAMTQAAAAGGDRDPKFTSNRTNVNGLDARRASYRKAISGGELMHIDAVFATSGRRIWQVQVIYLDESRAADAARILDSIIITPPP